MCSVSMAMKLHEKRVWEPTRKTAEVWETKLVSYHQRGLVPEGVGGWGWRLDSCCSSQLQSPSMEERFSGHPWRQEKNKNKKINNNKKKAAGNHAVDDFTCGVCSCSVPDSDQGVLCVSCEVWQHANCVALSASEYAAL